MPTETKFIAELPSEAVKHVSPSVEKEPKLSLIRPVPEIIKSFPKTRYYGSKRKLLPWLFSCVNGLKFQTVLDVFGGTGSVSLMFKSMGKTISYHDSFNFNSDIASTVLSNELSMTADELNSFLSGIKTVDDFITRTFRDIFFTAYENQWLDGFMCQIESCELSREQRRLLMYLLYQACLKKRPFNLFHRANLNLRTNKATKRSFGNYATWERSFEDHMIHELAVLRKFGLLSIGHVKILPPGDVTKLKAGYDLVYLDPPYINKNESYNRDDYWRRYHFLEGLSRYRLWPKKIDHSSPIRLSRPPEWMFQWGTQRGFEALLSELIEKHSESTVILSYVSDAYPKEDRLREIFENHFSEVTVHTKEHSYALSRSKRRELLFIGKP